ncbi:MAG TPA: hypothetical protein VGK31_12350 [Thermoanaerobaculia bacterium]
MRAGEIAHIRNGDNQVVLTYRGFASVVSIVAALVAGIVIVAGVAAALFLIAESRHPAAVTSLVLSIGFSAIIATLVPRTRVTLYDGSKPALVITQKSRIAFPRTTYAVKTHDGATIALLGRSTLSRLGRNSWSIDSAADQRGSGFAVEESLMRAIVRKFAGKFNRSREANIRLYHQGIASGVIVRRPDATGEVDYLDLAANATLDRRVAVALATLVFGAEP